jgi:hypothetical protein
MNNKRYIMDFNILVCALDIGIFWYKLDNGFE